MWSYLPNGNGLQNSLFYFFKAVMVFIKNSASSLYIYSFFGSFVPRNIENSVQIITENRGFSRTKRLLAKSLNILHKLRFCFFSKVKKENSLFILGKFGVVIFAQFFTNRLHLFPKEVVFLFLVNISSRLFLNVGFQAEHLHFLPQKLHYSFQPAQRIQHTQKSCFVLIFNAGILGNRICKKITILRSNHTKLYRLRRHLCKTHVIIIKSHGLTAQSPRIQIFFNGCLRNFCDNTGKVRFCMNHLGNFCPRKSIYQNTDIITLRFKNLLYFYHRTYRIQIRQTGIIVQDIFLRDKHQNLVLFHSRFQGHHRF